ncbi:hypothetical protein OU415_02340 [Saccharopolyspora sp. WRP15-2]|uniref:Uncharacterized protein n=1 Tax=Saccharopolyspora oryzae TaxID=2997343 RepID=A0ABT4USL4_9PSEU|nr:hypothetical protein [Saccharopolyspora oryzae]MDA3624256.1 hypothetical protein [Saccharopolyspora oryzae]
MGYIEGARHRDLVKAGAPVNGDFNGEADKGAVLRDSTTGKLYINTGTLAATVWTLVGAQV